MFKLCRRCQESRVAQSSCSGICLHRPNNRCCVSQTRCSWMLQRSLRPPRSQRCRLQLPASRQTQGCNDHTVTCRGIRCVIEPRMTKANGGRAGLDFYLPSYQSQMFKRADRSHICLGFRVVPEWNRFMNTSISSFKPNKLLARAIKLVLNQHSGQNSGLKHDSEW